MAIFSGSRYSVGENGKKITATQVTRGSRLITFLHDRKVYTIGDLKNPVDLHEVESAVERADQLAFQASGDSTKWFLIADVNGFFYADEEFIKGRRVHVPKFEDFRSV